MNEIYMVANIAEFILLVFFFVIVIFLRKQCRSLESNISEINSYLYKRKLKDVLDDPSSNNLQITDAVIKLSEEAFYKSCMDTSFDYSPCNKKYNVGEEIKIRKRSRVDKDTL